MSEVTGIYIEEFKMDSNPIEGVSTSTAGLLGVTERGPTAPKLVTSFKQFDQIYGSYLENSFLPYAVNGFFQNGGQRCFIARIVRIKDEVNNAKILKVEYDSIIIEAIGPGKWAGNAAIKIEIGTMEKIQPFPENLNKLFKMTFVYWSKKPPVDPLIDPASQALDFLNSPGRREPDVVEIYDNLSCSPESPEFYEKRINDISKLIKIYPAKDIEGNQIYKTPDNLEITLLASLSNNPADVEGYDGSPITEEDFEGRETEMTSEKGELTTEKSGFKGFKQIDEISIVCAPIVDDLKDLSDMLVDHCEDPDLKDRFAILHSAQNNIPNQIASGFNPPKDSKYAAFYYPWIKIFDPLTGGIMLIPPVGHIAGIYARSDTENGVHKAPANEIILGAQDIQFPLGKSEQDILNPRGVNVIRALTGKGILLWGARTTSSDPLWKYINVRRLLIYIEESIEKGTQWVVFEPNDEKLWARLKESVQAFLNRVWMDGALMGKTTREAFFVKCDRSTMTQDDLDNGRLICMIGVAPVKPAEFIIFRIAQWVGGSCVME